MAMPSDRRHRWNLSGFHLHVVCYVRHSPSLPLLLFPLIPAKALGYYFMRCADVQCQFGQLIAGHVQLLSSNGSLCIRPLAT